MTVEALPIVFELADGSPSTELIAAYFGLAGAVLGSLVSGIISWWLQRSASFAAQKTLASGKLFTALVRMNYVFADTSASLESIQQAQEHAKAANLDHLPLHAKVSYLPGVGQAQPLNPDEIVPIASADRSAAAKFCEVLMQHAILIDQMLDYNARTQRLFDKVPMVETSGGTFQVDEESRVRYASEFRQRSQLIELLVENAEHIKSEAKDVRSRIIAIGEAYPDFPR